MKPRIKIIEVGRTLKDLSDLTDEEIENLPDIEKLECVDYDFNIFEEIIDKLYNKFILDKEIRLSKKFPKFSIEDEDIII